MQPRYRFFLLFVFLLGSTAVASAQSSRPDSLKELYRQIDVLTQEIERLKLGEVAEPSYKPTRGLGPAAARVYQLKKSGVSLAGYGELLYENYAATHEDGAASQKKDRLDYLRTILYVGFRYNDWIVFNSEIEFEHASTGKAGEVSVEFGYIDLMFSNNLNLRTGMVLPPVGIINEKHEPSTFFGTLRPQVERSIVPSTWRTIGVGLYGDLAPGLDYRVYLVEGLNAAKFTDADGIRGGRQSGSKSLAEDWALTGKIEYKGFRGTVLGASFHSGNSGQGATDAAGVIDAGTTLFTLHAEHEWRGLELRGLYAHVSVDQADRVSRLAGKTIGSEMRGWYVVVGYDVMPLLAPGSTHSLSPYLQYEELNTHAAVPAGFLANPALDRSVLTAGLSYKPHPNVAFKVDYQDNKNKAKTGVPAWNVALNYLF